MKSTSESSVRQTFKNMIRNYLNGRFIKLILNAIIPKQVIFLSHSNRQIKAT